MRYHRRSAITLAAQACLLSACGLSKRPFVQPRQWPMVISRPIVLPERTGGMIIELRPLRAGPGLDNDALQAVQADGSVDQQFYERWAVQPADGVTECLRLWLSQSGHYAAVVSEGSRAVADIAIEGTLTSLHVDLGFHTAQAVIALTIVDLRSTERRILLQTSLTGTTDLADTRPMGQVQSQLVALGKVFDQIEHAVPQ